MTSFVLKWVAVITMLIDHVGLLFFPEQPGFRIIGRLSFPIFCFLLAQGFIYTKSRRRYLLQLSAFALISTVPHHLFLRGTAPPQWGDSLNVMFELAAGIVALLLLERAQNNWEKTTRAITLRILCVLGFVGVCILSEFLNFSYGAYGILLIAGFYLFRDQRYYQYLALILCTLAQNIVVGNSPQVYAVFACLVLWPYNGKKGRDFNKYVFYLFYPVHLLLLYGIYMLIN